MKNLFLNVLRSLKKNKLAIIGLTFLVFLSTGIFVSLNSTTSAVTNEYKKITRDGNLHQFTVSELYESSTPKYTNSADTYEDAAGVKQYTGLYNQDHLVMSSDNELMPYIAYNSDADKFTMWYTLDIANLRDTSAVKNFYIQTMASESEYEKYGTYIEPAVDFSLDDGQQKTNLISYIDTDQKAYGKSAQTKTAKPAEDIQRIIDVVNYASSDVQKQLSTAGNEVVSLSSTNSTPMQQYLSNTDVGVGKEVQYRKFRSINIDNSADSVFYKGVLSNPDDQIDKMVLIKTKNFDTLWDEQWNNFNIKDATYGILDFNDKDEWDLGKTLKYLPESIGSTFDKHYVKKVFLLSKTDFGSTQAKSPIWQKVDPLTTNKTLPKSDQEYQEYWDANKANLTSLLQEEKNESEVVYVKDYRVTLQWSGAAPSTALINNWTSYFAVVNPEYMEANNLRSMSSDMYENEASYQRYIKANPGIVDQRQRFIGWLNSLKYPDIDAWFNSVQNKKAFKNQIVKPGGGTPYIILGSGITPDFVYPIVSISRSTPNPNSECIFFANDAGYGRIYDGFRSNETENYLVGTFNSGVNQQATLDKINDEAAKIMIYPKGTKAAYMADDTNNVLNAAAFRIVFIPNFISEINLVSNALTIFIIVLALVICAIVIHRYIVNSQSVLGVMRANGLSRSKIALSMLPFALIPSIGGGLIGVIVGTFLQLPILSMFRSYWMLPTAVMGFSWIGLLIAVFLSFAFFFAVIFITTFWILRKKTVDLMKANSQDNPNVIAKLAKASVAKFGIVAKYRMAVAFSSLWKLIVLTLMTTMSLSSLVFAFSIRGKFENSITLTTNSRNYDYAIKLQTPTLSGGQYTPVAFYEDEDTKTVGMSGVSGYNKAGNDDRDNSYLQSIYFGGEDMPIIPGGLLGDDITLPGIGYDVSKVPKIDVETQEGTKSMSLNTALARNYYYASMCLDYTLNADKTQGMDIDTYIAQYLDAFEAGKDKNNKPIYASNVFVPFMDDSNGQKYDLFYLKDRVQTRDTIDYVVGMPALDIASNPWDIAASMMPENNSNMAKGSSAVFVNAIGKSLNDPKTDEEKALKDAILNDDFIKGQITGGYITEDEIKAFYKKDLESGQYVIVSDNVVGQTAALALRQVFLKIMTICYNKFALADQNYYISYNTVPLLKEDETYTYLDATNLKDNSTVSIMGVKATPGHETKYMNLTDDKGKNILSSIHYTYEDLNNNVAFPIIINAFVAQKYNLGIDDTISFKVNNLAERFQHQILVDKDIKDPEYDNKTQVQFKVKGICSTYQGQEYFIDQDVANYILDLKTHLLDKDLEEQTARQPNSYYGYAPDTMGSPTDTIANIVVYTPNGSTSGKATLINTKEYQKDVTEANYQLTPYGFNGVFTKNINGKPANPVLTKGINLYAPSGIWCGTDRTDSNILLELLQYGSNVKIASMLLLNEKHPLWTNIDLAYKDWQDAIAQHLSSSEITAKHDTLAAYATDIQEIITRYFGTSSYQMLLSGAIDKMSTSLVYNKMSTTISTLTDVVIAFVTVMVVIIVALITNMIINDSRRLAALLKTLGYSDRENILTYLSIYIPVIVVGLALSAAITIGLVSAYNAIILEGMQIWINASVEWYYYLIGLGAVGAIFAVSGIAGAASLKKAKVSEEIKR